MTKFYFIAFLFGIFLTYGNENIDYNPKILEKEIEKVWGYKSFVKEEILIPDSIIGPKMNGKFFAINSENPNAQNKFAFIGRVNSCRVGGCSISGEAAGNAESEYFDYFILLDSTAKVELVKVFNYQATHGQEVTAKGWLKQFNGFDGTTNLEVGKNIDAISGATISVYAITCDVQIKTLLLKRLIGNN